MSPATMDGFPRNATRSAPYPIRMQIFSSSGSRCAHRLEGIHRITAKSGGDGVRKGPETMKPTDSAMNHPQTVNIAEGRRFRTADATINKIKNKRAQGEEMCANLKSPLSPRWRRRRGEKRKVASFWLPGERAGEADCSSPLTQISQEILMLNSAATVHRSNGIPMGHGREVQAL